MGGFDDLLAAARQVRDHAYAPYSGFKVAAALRGGDGRIHVGVNVENASYPVGLCAEAAAIAGAVAAGERRIIEVLLLTGGTEPAPPCGACRQRLTEFAGPDTPVHLCTTAGAKLSFRLAELLPLSFAASHLRG